MPFGLIFLKLSQHITVIVGKNSWALICEIGYCTYESSLLNVKLLLLYFFKEFLNDAVILFLNKLM
jgi:hypothetical protein